VLQYFPSSRIHFDIDIDSNFAPTGSSSCGSFLSCLMAQTSVDAADAQSDVLATVMNHFSG
jgi:hypothetical protein